MKATESLERVRPDCAQSPHIAAQRLPPGERGRETA